LLPERDRQTEFHLPVRVISPSEQSLKEKKSYGLT
jgi:hypothetical protein